MLHTITVYTAFRQFIEMVERRENLEEHNVSERQVQSCPVEQSALHNIRKTVSCPVALAHSPIPTSIESRKFNEASEAMMSFWKVPMRTSAVESSIDSVKWGSPIVEVDDGNLADDESSDSVHTTATSAWSTLSPPADFSNCNCLGPNSETSKSTKSNESSDSSSSESSSSSTSESSSSSTSTTSSIYNNRVLKQMLKNQRIRLLEDIIAEQGKTMNLLIELNSVTDELASYRL